MSPTQRKTQSESTNGHSESHQEAYESWSRFYQQMADEGMDFYQKGMDMFQKMSPFYPGSPVFSDWVQNYQDFLNRMGEETGKAQPGDKDAYKRMYDAWLDTWTRNFESYMRTPEFASKSGKDLEAFSDMKQKVDEMMEAYWHAMNLPTARDIQEIYHKLYLIDRKLDDLDRRFREAEQKSKSSAPAKKSKK